MHVHRSNRVEHLVRALAELVRRPAGSPTEPETIVVQGPGMERWLSQSLAHRLGIWANPDFPFPRALVERAFDAVLGEAEGPPLDAESLTWSVAAALPQLLDRPVFEPLRTYLRDDPGGARLLALSRRIADVFDQYTVYRPRMVQTWEKGEGDDFQAVLFRETVGRSPRPHAARRAEAFRRALGQAGGPIDGLPRRISLFGLTTLPPLYLGALAELSRRVEVHLFLLSPSQEWWAHIRSRREQIRALLRQDGDEAPTADGLLLEEGHPLLASMGRLGRDFQLVLEEADDYAEEEDLYEDPGTGSMLATLQSHVLHLRHPGVDPAVPPLHRAKEDRSIELHSCHGPMRELEVLHDRLVALFDDNEHLRPRDVVVMAPDIDAYAPVIDAVFGGDGRGRPRIPYSIADRGVRSEHEVVDALLRVLAALDGRFTATELLDLLSAEPVRARFGIQAADLDALRALVEETGIRWGIDASHRAELGQPADGQNTWRFGLNRLLLGYAMPGRSERLFGGTLPFDDVEGDTAALAGRLADFCETLFAFRSRVAALSPVPVLCEVTGELLDALIADTPTTAHQHRLVRRALGALAERATGAGFEAPLDLATFRRQLELCLSTRGPARGFLARGITFCQLVPMRSVPFAVVCLVGMNDGAFPRQQGSVSFDLIAKGAPRPGDRSRRNEDRHLFLEALLSARERLLITYVGQSIRDGATLPPSVLVGDLLDAISETFEDPPLRIDHPLQPFSPRYFGGGDDPALFSYARAYCDGARALLGSRRQPDPFLTHALPLDETEHGTLSLDALERFFREPIKRLLQGRLGLFLEDQVEALTDREPVFLEGLDRWRLGSDLLERALSGADPSTELSLVRASGILPPGVPGACTYAEVHPEAQSIAAASEGLFAGGRLPPLEVDVTIADTRLTGALRRVYPGGQVHTQYSRLGGRAELALWIRHLLLNLCGGAGAPRETFLMSRPSKGRGAAVVRFRPVDDAESLLGELIALYRRGQGAPLLLFENASRAWAEAIAAGKPLEQAATSAHKAYGGDFGDDKDPYVRQVMGDRDPTATDFQPPWGGGDPGFGEVAERVFLPLLAHREEETA